MVQENIDQLPIDIKQLSQDIDRIGIHYAIELTSKNEMASCTRLSMKNQTGNN